jgi:hypothetical protein
MNLSESKIKEIIDKKHRLKRDSIIATSVLAASVMTMLSQLVGANLFNWIGSSDTILIFSFLSVAISGGVLAYVMDEFSLAYKGELLDFVDELSSKIMLSATEYISLGRLIEHLTKGVPLQLRDDVEVHLEVTEGVYTGRIYTGLESKTFIALPEGPDGKKDASAAYAHTLQLS